MLTLSKNFCDQLSWFFYEINAFTPFTLYQTLNKNGALEFYVNDPNSEYLRNRIAQLMKDLPYKILKYDYYFVESEPEYYI